VQKTGSTEFPYALRVSNFLAVSDSPIALNQNLWRSVLIDYKIDGHRVFDLADANARAQLEKLLSLSESWGKAGKMDGFTIESRSQMLGRLRGARVITDDNMGAEWY
jgi:hypothetical protein